MAVVVSLFMILLVAALVGRTCARSRPGQRAGTGHRHLDLPDVGVHPYRSGGGD